MIFTTLQKSVMRTTGCLLISLFAAMATHNCNGQDTPQSLLHLDAGDYLTFEGDERLELQHDGTIELWVAGNSADTDTENSNSADRSVILRHGDADDFNFEISASVAHDEIHVRFGTWNPRALRDDVTTGNVGTTPQAVPLKGATHAPTTGTAQCRLSDGHAHHIAVTTTSGICQIWVDGKPSGWPFYGTFRQPIVGGRNLYLGSDGQATRFQGDIGDVRFWASALPANQFNFPRSPNTDSIEQHAAYSDLIASSAFTSDSPSLRFHEEKIQYTLTIGHTGDTDHLALLPHGYTLHQVYAVEKDGYEKLRIVGSHVRHPPVIVPFKKWDVNSQVVTPNPKTDSKAEETLKDAIDACFLDYLAHADFNDKESSLRQKTKWKTLANLHTAPLNAIAATYDDRMRTLRIRKKPHSTKKQKVPDSWRVVVKPKPTGKTQTLPQAVSTHVPAHGIVRGIRWHERNQKITGMSIAYIVPNTPTVSQARQMESVRWIDRDSRGPIPADHSAGKDLTTPPDNTDTYKLAGVEFLSSAERQTKLQPLIDRVTALVAIFEQNLTLNLPSDDKRLFVHLDKPLAQAFVDFNWLRRNEVFRDEAMLVTDPENPGFEKIQRRTVIKGIPLYVFVPSLTNAINKVAASLRPPGRRLDINEPPTATDPDNKKLAIAFRDLYTAALIHEDNPILNVGIDSDFDGDDGGERLNNKLAQTLKNLNWDKHIGLPAPGSGPPWKIPSAPPRKDSVKPIGNPLGNYSTPPIATIKFSENDAQEVLLLSDSGARYRLSQTAPSVYEATVSIAKDDATAADSTKKDTTVSPVKVSLHIDVDEHAIWTNANLASDFAKHPTLETFRKLVVPPDYDTTISDDKIDWGGTFALQDRPTGCNANFRGYNLRKMHPKDHQADTGTDRRIFRYPSDGSKDYYSTDSKLIVPYGLRFVSDNGGTEGLETNTVSNSSERSRVWSTHLGANVGFGGKLGGASASMNAKWGGENSNMRSQGHKRTISRTVETRYALVMDKGKIQLSDDFQERIEELASLQLAQETIPEFALAQFVEAFGTHYAYAVTYGGMAVLEMDFWEKETKHKDGTNYDISASASAAYAGVSGSVNAGHSESHSAAVSRAQSRDRVKFDTYGGSLSKGQGWSLSKGEEVPIYLDLRTITELLNPIFFEDEAIYRNVRSQLQDHINKYLNQPIP